ncbi:MAG: hypothetical protein KAJ86_07970 [Alphaproteobacteria bacterium]|nr:hypothetical protein [Alphaproteobacteria bacterium]
MKERKVVFLMPDNDLSEEKYIEGQLEALEDERKAIQEQYDAGNVSEKEYKVLLAKNEYLAAQIKERNQQSQDKERTQAFERKRDMFND